MEFRRECLRLLETGAGFDAVREGGNDSKRLLRALLDVVLGPLVERFTVEPAPNERPDDEGSLIVKP